MRYILLLITIIFCVSLSAQSNPYRTRLYRDLVDVDKRLILRGTMIDSILASWDTAAVNDVTIPTTKWVEEKSLDLIAKNDSVQRISAFGNFVHTGIDTVPGTKIDIPYSAAYKYETIIFYLDNDVNFDSLRFSIGFINSTTSFNPSISFLYETRFEKSAFRFAQLSNPYISLSPIGSSLGYLKIEGIIIPAVDCQIFILAEAIGGDARFTRVTTKLEKLQ